MTFCLFECLSLLLSQAMFLGIQDPIDKESLTDISNMGLFNHLTPRKVKNGRPGNVLVDILNMNVRQRNWLGLLFDILSTFKIGIRINRSVVTDDLRATLLDINWIVDDRNLLDRLRAGQLPCFYAELVRWIPEEEVEGITID